MTTDLVWGVTDEMIADIERKAASKKKEGFELVHNLSCDSVLALLSERAELKRKLAESISLQSRAMQELAFVLYSKPYPENNPLLDIVAHIAELKRDAERYRLYRMGMTNQEAFDANIDQAMQERQK